MKRIAAALFVMASLASAQDPVSASGTGSVSGHVICGDTQRPARFAQVVLFGVPVKATPQAEVNSDTSQADQVKAMRSVMESMGKTNLVQAQTGVEGAFLATDVPPGDYYVFGAAAGYESPLNIVLAALAAGADASKPLPGVPTLHVSADRLSSVDVTMQRGAAISGTIAWDDGSPLAGAILSVTPAKGEQKPPMEFTMLAMTDLRSLINTSDDLGHFRITGLAPGDYIVKAMIQNGTQSGLGAAMNLQKQAAHAPMMIYAPAAFHSSDAKAVTVNAGEEAREENITLDLGKTYSVSGRIEAADDHHGINQATVRLTDKNDKELNRSAPVDAAGNYTVTFVPAGTYTLAVESAADTVPDEAKKKKAGLFNFGSDKSVRRYVSTKQDVMVAGKDLTGETISLAVDKNAKDDDGDMAGALGALLGGDDDDKKPSR